MKLKDKPQKDQADPQVTLLPAKTYFNTFEWKTPAPPQAFSSVTITMSRSGYWLERGHDRDLGGFGNILFVSFLQGNILFHELCSGYIGVFT